MFDAQAVSQFFRQIQLFHGVRRIGPDADLVLAVFFGDALQRFLHIFQRGLPIHFVPFAAVFDFRRFQTAFVIQALIGETVAVGNPAFVDGFVFQRQHAAHGVVFGLHNQVAAQRVMGGNRFAAAQFPRTGIVTERFAGERADGAQINHVARQFGFHRFADKRHDFGKLAAVGHGDFLHTGDFFGKTHAAGAVDAAAHFRGGNQRPHIFADYRTFLFGVAAGRIAIAHGQILQLAFAALVANRAVERVVDEQKLHHPGLRLFGLGRMSVHHHTVGYRRGAGRQRFGGFFHFHQTHAAVGGDRQFFVVAEVRNIGAQFVRRFHHSRALLDCNLFTVDFDL